MTKINWKQKLSSRKLWAMLAGFITGVAMILKLDSDTVTCVSGAIVSVFSTVSYIITEGRVDASRVANTVESVQSAVDAIENTKN